jgi:hypothetical protein
MIQIQKYDLDVRQIKEVQNLLADIPSHNPSGMTEEQTRYLTRPDQVMFHHIQVHEDQNLQKELKALAELQEIDEKLATIKNRVTKCHSTDQIQFVLQDNVLCAERERKLNSDTSQYCQAAYSRTFLNLSILH